MKTAAIIPARLMSTRLPDKVLLPIAGRPMLWHVWQRAMAASTIDETYIATDSDVVRRAAESWGGRVIMTGHCESGTDRVAAALPMIEADLVLNLQADEPLLDPFALDRLVRLWRVLECDIITLVFRLTDPQVVADPNVVKVVRDEQCRAMYFSRSPIPYLSARTPPDWWEQHGYWGHIGVYGFRPEVLSNLPQCSESGPATAEQLEQLHWRSAGFQIQTVESDQPSIAVDTREDLERVRALIGQSPSLVADRGGADG